MRKRDDLPTTPYDPWDPENPYAEGKGADPYDPWQKPRVQQTTPTVTPTVTPTTTPTVAPTQGFMQQPGEGEKWWQRIMQQFFGPSATGEYWKGVQGGLMGGISPMQQIFADYYERPGTRSGDLYDFMTGRKRKRRTSRYKPTPYWQQPPVAPGVRPPPYNPDWTPKTERTSDLSEQPKTERTSDLSEQPPLVAGRPRGRPSDRGGLGTDEQDLLGEAAFDTGAQDTGGQDTLSQFDLLGGGGGGGQDTLSQFDLLGGADFRTQKDYQDFPPTDYGEDDDDEAAFDMGSLNTGFGKFYQRTGEQASRRLDDILAARGIYGSGTGVEQQRQLWADLAAQQANREADYLAQLAAQGDTASMAQLAGMTNLGQAQLQDMLGRIGLGGKLAGEAESQELARLGLGMGGATTAQRLAEERERGNLADMLAWASRAGGAFTAAGDLSRAQEARINEALTQLGLDTSKMNSEQLQQWRQNLINILGVAKEVGKAAGGAGAGAGA